MPTVRGSGECAALAVALVSATFWPTHAPAQTPAPARPEVRVFDIPAQPMAAALNAWAVQANTQVFVDPGPVAHLMAPAVKGALTPRQALRALLAGSALQVTQGTDGVFVIKPRPAVARIAPPPPEPPQAVAAPAPAPPEPGTVRARLGAWRVGLGGAYAQDAGTASGGAMAWVAGEYFLTDGLAAALAASTPRTHSFDVPGAAARARASARVQSTALTLKFYFAPQGRVDPYVGAGLALTSLYDAQGVTSVQHRSSAATVTGGLDVRLSPQWTLNTGISWTQARPDANGAPVRLDPVQFSLGFLYRFGASGDILHRR